MSRQSAFFGPTSLCRTYDLAGTPHESRVEARERENSAALGGMRRPDRSVDTGLDYAGAGKELGQMLDGIIHKHPATLDLVEQLRLGHRVSGYDPVIMEEVRSKWLHTLASRSGERQPGPDADVLQAWGRATRDPDAADVLPSWLRTGAPLGILFPIEHTGVFPAVTPEEAPRDPAMLASVLQGFENNTSAEEQPQIVAELLTEQQSKGHCTFFDTHDEVVQYQDGQTPILTKLALISKQKEDGT